MYSCKFDFLQQSEVFRLALRSEDELFHVSLYDWLFTMNMTDKLLEVNTFLYDTVFEERSGPVIDC